MKVHTGDKVKITTGKDKGKEGKILSVDIKNKRVVVEGANIVTRHMKKQGTTPGQIIKMEKSIDVSNVMVIDSTGKATRIGYKVEAGKKERISKKTGKKI